jgi:hypothetical protein
LAGGIPRNQSEAQQLGRLLADAHSRVLSLSRRSPMPLPPSPKRRHDSPRTPKPADPASWLERTEGLVDRYRQQLHAAGGPSAGADPGLGYIWIAADHIFEARGLGADFALLDVPELMRDCAWLVTGKLVPFVAALTAFYAFLGEAGLIDPARAVAIQAELARMLPLQPARQK